MSILQPIHNIAEICARKNITNAILCPGSRSAALTISFVRHSKIKTYSISDERSAGYIGMGMAQQIQKPVILVCTSGTAAYNFAPAIAEAFFQEIPLIILTADRPKEWIHQQDGQTIYQTEIFGKHVKKSYELPSDYTHKDAVWQIERVMNEAINISETFPKGPVHINVPIREPFYPLENEEITFDKNVRIINQVQPNFYLPSESWNELLEIWNESENKLIAVGQTEFPDFVEVLQNISEEFGVVVLGDIISNIHQANSKFIANQDLFLGLSEKLKKLKPDLLITCGRSFISKNFKTFLRNNKPKYHFHLQIADNIIDSFQTITHKIQAQPKYFFTKLFEDLDFEKYRSGDEEENFDYLNSWDKINSQNTGKIQKYLDKIQFSDFVVMNEVLSILPENAIFHLGNSMSVRYANLIGLNSSKNIHVFSNRGTSGIDGCLSTAVGAALKTSQLVISILGDVSFFYDRNALWNNYIPNNLRIIVVNNQGGNIFRIIDGPNKQPELGEYFETIQKNSVKNSAIDASVEYLIAEDLRNLQLCLKTFFEKSDSAKLLEIHTDNVVNVEVFNGLRNS